MRRGWFVLCLAVLCLAVLCLAALSAGCAEDVTPGVGAPAVDAALVVDAAPVVDAARPDLGAADAALSGRCGDGHQDVDEVCDDGALNGEYALCAADCMGLGAHCGDGWHDQGYETCDDGALNGEYDRCAVGCAALGPRCGDGVWQPLDEACDDGEDSGGYGRCLEDCSALGPHCGDGERQILEETCDDGDENGAYGRCALDCQGEGARCGDGIVQAGVETCDDGAENGRYARCPADCSASVFPPPPYPVGHGPIDLDAPPACAPGDWLSKYLEYRTRLRGDGTAAYPGFVSVGAADGQSIPASRRDPSTDCMSDWYIQDAQCQAQALDDAQGKMNWGDATIWLGEYIGVLGTEYAAFTALGLDTTQTVEDLGFALAAFDRVDANAEAYFGVEPALDGFFLRDDVPGDFYLSEDGGYRFAHPDPAFEGYACIKSAAGCGEPNTDGGYFVSQDQVIGLIHGLALVEALVPDGVRHQGVELRHRARGQVHRMVMHLKGNRWRIEDPTGHSPPDEWGGNAIAFSNKLALAANRICGDDFGVDDYRDALSRVEGEAVFAGLIAIWDVTHAYNRTMAFRMVAVTDAWSPDLMAERTAADAKIGFALSHALLNGHRLGAAVAPWRIESLLSSAPCGGPCRDLPGCEEAKGWMGEHRLTNPGDRLGSVHHPQGEFTGLDYMTLHNLYLLYRAGGYELRPVEAAAPVGCDGVRTLEQIRTTGAASGETYDPGDPCHAPDLSRRFCGRTFAGWLDAAYRGEATLTIGGQRWTCEDGPCVLRSGAYAGDDGVDLMLGGDGDDVMRGDWGDDCMYGFGGADEMRGGRGRDEMHGGDGADVMDGEGALVDLNGEEDQLWGDAGDDELRGGPGRDELYGGEGDDRLIGDAGGDFLMGEGGHDYLQGDAGDDVLSGGVGDDEMHGKSGADVLWGGDGRDKLAGDSGADQLRGGDGDDFLQAGGGDDGLQAGAGVDILCGGDGDDTGWGAWDGDRCDGGDAGDEMRGCTDELLTDAECSDDAFDAW